MDYDFRNRSGTVYRPATSTASTPPMYGQSMYPRVVQHSPSMGPPVGRSSPYNHPSTPSPSASSSGLGIRVMIKPEYRINPPPQLLPFGGDIPRSNFQFDFDFERKVLAEAEKENQNWNKLGLGNYQSKTVESTSSQGSSGDPVVSKYIASGLSREAVPFAVAHYGDNPTKVREFVDAYTLLREMGFASNNVAEALAMYENDTDKALAHFLNSSSSKEF